MIFHIVKRELYDHLSSLRFALTTLLILILMIVNAIAYLGEYNQQMDIYQKNVAATHNRLKRHSDTLYHLVLKGPGDLHKKPSPLAFCADGGEDLLFRHVRGGTASRTRHWKRGRHFIPVHRNLAISLSTSQPRSRIYFATQIKHVEHHARFY